MVVVSFGVVIIRLRVDPGFLYIELTYTDCCGISGEHFHNLLRRHVRGHVKATVFVSAVDTASKMLTQ